LLPAFFTGVSAIICISREPRARTLCQRSLPNVMAGTSPAMTLGIKRKESEPTRVGISPYSTRSVPIDTILPSLQRQLIAAEHVIDVCQHFTEGKAGLVLIEFALEDMRDNIGN